MNYYLLESKNSMQILTTKRVHNKNSLERITRNVDGQKLFKLHTVYENTHSIELLQEYHNTTKDSITLAKEKQVLSNGETIYWL